MIRISKDTSITKTTINVFFLSENNEIIHSHNYLLQTSGHNCYLPHVALLRDSDHIEMTHLVSFAKELMSWMLLE